MAGLSKTILITGGAGFIGSNLVRFLNASRPEWKIRVLDDFSTGFEDNLSNCSADIEEMSVLDAKSLVKYSSGVDSIVHLAALGSVPRSIDAPLQTHEVNTTGTLNVLEAARNSEIRHVIVASSSSVYGSNPSLVRSELDWLRPLSPYAVSKLATEAYASAYAVSFGLRTLALRFFNVYGPHQRAGHPYAAVVPRFVMAALRNEPLEIFGDGEQRRDFTYVDSVCEALMLACESETWNLDPVNLAFGTSTSVNQLVNLLGNVLGQSLSSIHQASRPGDVLQSQADPSRMYEFFPDLKPVSLENGLATTVQWFSRID